MSSTIRIRRDTADNWADVNPILALGEISYATDTLEIRVGNGTCHWADILPPRGNNGAANVVMQTPSLTPEDGDTLTMMWFSPGVEAATPVPANWQTLATFTWNGTYDQPNQRVLLMLPDDEFPTVYAYVTPDEFLPLALNAGQLVTVQCAGSGFGETPSIWVGLNNDDEIGAGDPRTPASSFAPISLTASQVWLDFVEFTGNMSGQQGNSLTQAFRHIDELSLGTPWIESRADTAGDYNVPANTTLLILDPASASDDINAIIPSGTAGQFMAVYRISDGQDTSISGNIIGNWRGLGNSGEAVLLAWSQGNSAWTVIAAEYRTFTAGQNGPLISNGSMEFNFTGDGTVMTVSIENAIVDIDHANTDVYEIISGTRKVYDWIITGWNTIQMPTTNGVNYRIVSWGELD